MAKWTVTPVAVNHVPEDDLDERLEQVSNYPEEHRDEMRAEIGRQREQRKGVKRVTLDLSNGTTTFTRSVDVKGEAGLREMAAQIIAEAEKAEAAVDLSTLVGQAL